LTSNEVEPEPRQSRALTSNEVEPRQSQALSSRDNQPEDDIIKDKDEIATVKQVDEKPKNIKK
jgi:hypothetical protein